MLLVCNFSNIFEFVLLLDKFLNNGVTNFEFELYLKAILLDLHIQLYLRFKLKTFL